MHFRYLEELAYGFMTAQLLLILPNVWIDLLSMGCIYTRGIIRQR